MKRLMYLLVGVALVACQENEAVSEFTGNETTYNLQSASQYSVSGVITFKERKDGTTSAVVDLKGTDGDQKFPVHLHLGNLSTPAADIAVLLSPVTANIIADLIEDKQPVVSIVSFQPLRFT